MRERERERESWCTRHHHCRAAAGAGDAGLAGCAPLWQTESAWHTAGPCVPAAGQSISTRQELTNAQRLLCVPPRRLCCCSNVLLSRDCRAFVADLGLARVLTASTHRAGGFSLVYAGDAAGCCCHCSCEAPALGSLGLPAAGAWQGVVAAVRCCVGTRMGQPPLQPCCSSGAANGGAVHAEC